jgi:large subunit ribosomal protein L2
MLSKIKPNKQLVSRLKKFGGRNNLGRQTNFNKGGGFKKLYRRLDKIDIGFKGILCTIEYDPCRSGLIGCVFNWVSYGFMYVLLPTNVTIGHIIGFSELNSKLYIGYQYQLKHVPIGYLVFNIDFKFCKSAGVYGIILQHTNNYSLILLPSGKKLKINSKKKVFLGSVSNSNWRFRVLGKAGRTRNLGLRPKVRGIAMNPVDHPHGGRSNGGRHPVTPWGKPTKGCKKSV